MRLLGERWRTKRGWVLVENRGELERRSWSRMTSIAGEVGGGRRVTLRGSIRGTLGKMVCKGNESSGKNIADGDRGEEPMDGRPSTPPGVLGW